jgi:mannose-6-phosphate isomerase-like protein (cupin superfamily)
VHLLLRDDHQKVRPKREVHHLVNMEKVNITHKFSQIRDYYSPRIAGEINDSYLKMAKLKGEFVWHHHELEDELFLVVKGTLRMMVFEDGGEREIRIAPGEFIVIPHGVEHKPIADEEVHLLLLEPKSTLNTGNVRNEKTLQELQRI